MSPTARAAVLCKRVRDHGDQAAFAELVRRNHVAIRLTVREFRWAQDTYGLEHEELMQQGDLRILSTELTRDSSSTEREALTRVMLDEELGGAHTGTP